MKPKANFEITVSRQGETVRFTVKSGYRHYEITMPISRCNITKLYHNLVEDLERRANL